MDQSLDMRELILSLKKDIQDLKNNVNEKAKATEEKLISVGVKIDENVKIAAELSTQVNNLVQKNSELTKIVLDLKGKTQNLEEAQKKLQNENRELKRECDNIRKETADLKAQQDSTLDSIAMLQMQRRENTLRFRGLTEDADEIIEKKISKELAAWLDLEEAEIAQKIEKAFRVKSNVAKANNWPADCLVSFNSMDFRNRILHASNKKKFQSEGNDIIVHKIIPNRLIKKREAYRPLAKALKAKAVYYRWEYPGGISFFFKEKRRKCLSALDADKFWRKYRKDLGGKRQLLGESEEIEQTDES
ncbi:Hypothetical predicted protein [Podarcis lilfordi]|uniref:L1 transposable element RRM domain-containing protein n=1 Tax=Podarcis lilfordi TaxID=74358 RepID=A0AA35L729_9SAUR|nr:Hypothetical predicted protein [Podarcis lilfordi]